MIINHNLPGANAISRMNANSASASSSMQKLSSGLRINKAGDDAAGLAISEKMRGQIRGLDQASANAQDGISMIQTAEGALSETHSILQRMRELAVQSSNDTNVAVDRSEIQKEMDELAKEVTRISNNTEFNTQKLINGGIKTDGINSAKFHVGANANQDITLSINAMDAKSLGVSRDVTTATGTTAGDVNTATFESTVGAKIVNAAELTFQYNAAGAGTATAATATAGSLTASTTDVSTLSGTAQLSITIDGTAYDIGDAALKAAAGAGKTDTDLTGAINTAIGTSGTASIVGGKIQIVSATSGTSSNVSIGFGTSVAGDKALLTTAFGFAGTETATGLAAVPTSANVTVSDGTTSQAVDITDATATTFKVTSGNYQGVTITMDATKTLADLDSTNDKVTVAATTKAATATTFADNEKTADAVTEAGIDVSTQTAASSSITTIQTAIETVSAERSKLGAYQNRLEHTIANLGTSSENLTSAESRIRDVDMAKEMSTFSKNNILAQAAQAMLAQANTQPQQVLQLLR
ncbi:flagellin [Clostridium beijerinckii]|nr:flagellin [Clostridium beijerinckii]